jgi:hypothetical protein
LKSAISSDLSNIKNVRLINDTNKCILLVKRLHKDRRDVKRLLKCGIVKENYELFEKIDQINMYNIRSL